MLKNLTSFILTATFFSYQLILHVSSLPQIHDLDHVIKERPNHPTRFAVLSFECPQEIHLSGTVVHPVYQKTTKM